MDKRSFIFWMGTLFDNEPGSQSQEWYRLDIESLTFAAKSNEKDSVIKVFLESGFSGIACAGGRFFPADIADQHMPLRCDTMRDALPERSFATVARAWYADWQAWDAALVTHAEDLRTTSSGNK